jgi:hypothetical protein
MVCFATMLVALGAFTASANAFPPNLHFNVTYEGQATSYVYGSGISSGNSGIRSPSGATRR